MIDKHLSDFDKIANEDFNSIGLNATVSPEAAEEEQIFLEEGLTVDASHLDDDIV